MAVSHDINDPNAFILYRYHPSLAGAAIFTVLFALSTLLHVYQSFRKRAYFMIPFIIGGLMEMLGYIGRILSSNSKLVYVQGTCRRSDNFIDDTPSKGYTSVYSMVT
jgi:hypothetical protein